jgi:hypothetical protein
MLFTLNFVVIRHRLHGWITKLNHRKHNATHYSSAETEPCPLKSVCLHLLTRSEGLLPHDGGKGRYLDNDAWKRTVDPSKAASAAIATGRLKLENHEHMRVLGAKTAAPQARSARLS